MSKHTKGPWEWWDVGLEQELMLLPKGSEKTHADAILTLGWVSCGDGSRGEEPSQADKNLIAAAPELLEALQECHRVLGKYVKEHRQRDEDFDTCSKAWNAIMKAMGG